MSTNETAAQAQMVEIPKQQVAATLAAALITAAGGPQSIAQAVALHEDIYFALYPGGGSGAYQNWQKTKDERLNRVHKAEYSLDGLK